ncbi:hypothetical protein [Argonema antarcticum]|uniref:hypothetical protein n=1 Tax=Argonema antarcticum TaxID=2942763 RepID=UPI0020118C50|nr:hypothetical protein [Argonema antarcticum]MCL1471331.1 hypothetical protein [Argonema antarcticum A004/B2]
MILTELLPKLQELPRADKLRAIEFLASELAKEEEAAQQKPTFASVTLYNSFEAAHTLAKLLEEDKRANNA